MFLHFVLDSVYSLSIAELLKKIHPDNKHMFIMMQHSGSSQQYSTLKDLQRVALAISPSDQLLYERVSDAWLAQFEKVFIHGLFHTGLTQLLLNKVSAETFQKIYFIPYDSEVLLAIRLIKKGYCSAANVVALQKLVNWVIHPDYRKIRSDFFESYDASACRFIEMDPLMVQPLQPFNMDDIEDFVRQRCSKLSGTVNVMIGHSCSRSNNHIETLKSLAFLSEENIRVILPMSYHVELNYRQEVCDLGKSIFGNKLIVWTDYMQPRQYREHLKLIDVGIFNLTESSGFGVISYLAMIGVKLYFNHEQLESGSISTLTQQGCRVFDFLDLDVNPSGILEPLLDDERINNFNLLSGLHFSTAKLIKNWTVLTSMSNFK
jgi:hypothetical protein